MMRGQISFLKSNIEATQRNLIRERVECYGGVQSLLNWEVVSFLTNIKLEELQGYKSLQEIREKLELVNATKLQKQKLKAIFELSNRIAKEKVSKGNTIKNPGDVAEILMEEMRHQKREEFRIVMLNTKNEILGIKTTSIGTLNASLVHPREVFKEAIINSSASVILVHGHPSGNPAPSKEDISITKRLHESGKLLGIEVLDHIIIGDGRYASLKEEGII